MGSPMQWTRHQKFSRGVWAVAFAAIVVVGSLTGAQLKSDEQKTEVRVLPSCHISRSLRIMSFFFAAILTPK